jgi:predicted phosphodiesterase
MPIIKNIKISLSGIEKIAILADCGCVKDWEEHFPRLLEDVWKTHSPQLFIVIGDIVLRGRFRYFNNIIKYIDRIPSKWAGLPGNHDRPLIIFKKYFGSLHKIIDVGIWRLIGVNTADKKFTRRESAWLEKNIAKNTIILSHVPPDIEGWGFYSLPSSDSKRFLDIVRKYRDSIKAVFFGHIHGLSRKEFAGVPMIVTGGAAHSKVIKNNRYNENTLLEMVIFDVRTGEMKIHEMK